MSNILKGLNEGRSYGRDSWDSNMPGYQGDYGGAENFGRRNREWDEDDRIDARLRAQHAQKQEYEQNGKFWLKFKDSQRHLPAGPFIGKQAANTAAIELLKQQPELKGNLLITAYGPDEQLDELSNNTLASYKKKAGADATQADKRGDYARGNKRMSGIVKATKKEFDNDAKGVEEGRYDSGDYYNARQGYEYGARSPSVDSGGYEFDKEVQRNEPGGDRGRPKNVKGVSKSLPADAFGRTTGKIPAGKTGRIHSMMGDIDEELDENLNKWFKEKWVRFGPDGKIRGDCARGDDSEGKPKCLPQSKAQNLGKEGRASAASRKRREDPNPERSGKAINVNTKKKSNEGVAEGWPGELAGGTIGGIAGNLAGSAIGGPIGGVVGGAVGGAGGGIIGRELTKEEQLNEFAPILAAGARLVIAMAPKISQVLKSTGKATVKAAAPVAKSGAEIAAKNAGQIGLGLGAYEIGSSVADIAKDITAKVGTALEEKTVMELAQAAFKFAIPAGIVLAILYGGKKVIDSLFSNSNQQQGVAEGSLNEFAPGDSGDDRTYEYEVYQCNPDDEFDWIGGPLYKTDRMDKAHGIAYELWKKHPDKAFMIWQERSQGSRGGYGIKDDKQGVAEEQHSCPHCGGEIVSEELMNEKKDACYYKVKSRYKVWPSAYASGALVKCRKSGADSWGNGGKKNEGVAEEQLDEKWTKKYKDSINCSNPKGFSQKAHCAGKQKNESAIMKGLK